MSILDFPIYPLCHEEAVALWIETEQYKAVGAALAAARRRAQLTQQELARRVGKPQSFVSEYERGQRRIDVIEFILITRTLGTDPLSVLAEIVSTLPSCVEPQPS